MQPTHMMIEGRMLLNTQIRNTMGRQITMENNTIPRERDGSACVLLLCVSVCVCWLDTGSAHSHTFSHLIIIVIVAARTLWQRCRTFSRPTTASASSSVTSPLQNAYRWIRHNRNWIISCIHSH